MKLARSSKSLGGSRRIPLQRKSRRALHRRLFLATAGSILRCHRVGADCNGTVNKRLIVYAWAVSAFRKSPSGQGKEIYEKL